MSFRGKYEKKNAIKKRSKTMLESEIAKTTLSTMKRFDFVRVTCDDFTIDKENIIVKIKDINSFKVIKDEILLGHKLMPNVYDLYLSINKTDNIEEKAKIMISWFKDNTLPYNINRICKTIDSQDIIGKKKTIDILKIDTQVNIKTFINDLNFWGQRLELYLAIRKAIDDNDISFIRNRTKFDDLYDYLNVADDVEDNKFVSYIKKNYKLFISLILTGTPDSNMCLIFNEKDKVCFSVKYTSIFDICWFNLYRFISDIGIICDDSGVIINSKSQMLRCPACNRTFVKETSRQIYCGRPECESERKRINKNNFDDRKRKPDKVKMLKERRNRKKGIVDVK